MKNRHLALVLLCLGSSFLPAKAEEHPLLVSLAGDSTVAEGGADGVFGWGHYLQGQLGPTVKVINHAVAGQTAKSFQMDGHWHKVLHEKPEIVLIEFGTNDAGEIDRGAMPESDYRQFIERYIDSAKAAHAHPILLTSIHLRGFDKGKPSDTIGPLAEIVRSVAQRKQVPLIDMYDLTNQLFTELGPQKCRQLGPGGNPVHFNEMGAKIMAVLVARELRRVEPRLAKTAPVAAAADATGTPDR